MNRYLFSLLLPLLLSCSGNNTAKHPEIETTVATPLPCDSIEIEMFDESGKPYVQKVPCDTIRE
jgi:hypothetical protein